MCPVESNLSYRHKRSYYRHLLIKTTLKDNHFITDDLDRRLSCRCITYFDDLCVFRLRIQQSQTSCPLILQSMDTILAPLILVCLETRYHSLWITSSRSLVVKENTNMRVAYSTEWLMILWFKVYHECKKNVEMTTFYFGYESQITYWDD